MKTSENVHIGSLVTSYTPQIQRLTGHQIRLPVSLAWSCYLDGPVALKGDKPPSHIRLGLIQKINRTKSGIKREKPNALRKLAIQRQQGNILLLYSSINN